MSVVPALGKEGLQGCRSDIWIKKEETWAFYPHYYVQNPVLSLNLKDV